MNKRDDITKQIFQGISECFQIPESEITRDYKIGTRVENAADFDLQNLDKTPSLLNLVEFTIWLEEEIPEDIYRTPAQLRQDRLFHKRLAFGLVTAGSLIDWMVDYLSGDTSAG